ncbi:MAG: acyltransferase family protein [Ginsengibacter sp.]
MPDTNTEVINEKNDRVLSGSIAMPAPTELAKASAKGQRLASLDFYRGLIMVLLMLESTGMYEHLLHMSGKGSFLHTIAIQFTHYPWHGLHFWDLIQPGFMFIAGVAMAFSLYKQTANGVPWGRQFSKALKRSGWLFFWGVLDYAVRGDHLSFELWDVLTQLSFTLLVAFLIFRWKPAYQLLFSAGLLILTETLYRYTNVPGFTQPFTDQHNFGNYIDVILMNKINPDGWVAINCIPTAAHTIWGAVAGKWLLTLGDSNKKLRNIFLLGIITLVLGFGLDAAGVTPIIKRIATSSFTLASGGLCLLALGLLFWWIDLKDHKKWLKFFVIVGMNSIFIYLFFEIVVSRWLGDYLNTIVNGLISPPGFSQNFINIVSALVIFAFEWGLCYWLYKKKIFFKL